jgi:hypothetical protein
MRKLSHVALFAIASVTGTMMCAGSIVTGCGSSSSGGGETDSGPDSVAPKPDSSVDSGHDSGSTTPDATTDGPSTTDSPSTTDASDGGGKSDSGGQVDSGEDGPVIGPDASDGGSATDASDGGGTAKDAATEAGDAGGDAGSCVTVFTGSDGGKGTILYDFDNGVLPTGWGTTKVDATDAGLDPTLTVTTADGHACPGALELTVPFSAFAQQADAVINLPGPAYSGSTFHFWVKVVSPTAADGGTGPTVGNEFIKGNGQVYAQWRLTGADAGLYSNSNFVNFYPPQFTDWKEVDVALSNDAGPIAIDLAQLGGNLLLQETDAAAPAPMVLLIDDIWLE